MAYYYELERRPDELYHHGIKGQKWGVRRFQNANGSLTNAGRKRMRLSEKAQARKRAKKQQMLDRKDEILKSAKPRDVLKIQDELTMNELREATERVRLNNELKNATKVQKGKSIAERIIKNSNDIRKATIAVVAASATVYKFRKELWALLNGEYINSLRH
jgi:hypothetical protein